MPYFLVVREDAAARRHARPTVLYGYGGFEISHDAGLQRGRSARRGWSAAACYVVANIRGGGEYGPAWHQAALRENRQSAYDDFIAVAEDLDRAQGHVAARSSASWAAATAAC